MVLLPEVWQKNPPGIAGGSWRVCNMQAEASGWKPVRLEGGNKVANRIVVNFETYRPDKEAETIVANLRFIVSIPSKSEKMPSEMLVKLKLEKALTEILRNLWTAEILLNEVATD